MNQELKFFKAKYIVAYQDGDHKILENGYMSVKGKVIKGIFKELPEGAEFEDLSLIHI